MIASVNTLIKLGKSGVLRSALITAEHMVKFIFIHQPLTIWEKSCLATVVKMAVRDGYKFNVFCAQTYISELLG